MDWNTLEEHVRSLAGIIFGGSFRPNRLNGVNLDAFFQKDDDEIIIIEITKQFSLEKVREDIAKLKIIKIQKSSEGCVVRAYIILQKPPTAAMLDAASSAKIKVLTIQQLYNQAFNQKEYTELRSRNVFGSAVDPVTGDNDRSEFINVQYFDKKQNILELDDFEKLLNSKNKLILLGEYGTGKSRCIRELFDRISRKYLENQKFVLAINLREHWGAQTGIEIISGHLARCGMTQEIDKLMKLINLGYVTILLDGFDEIGSQTFIDSSIERFSARKRAMLGVSDLIQLSRKSGILITGREHYFNNNQELLSAFGITESINLQILNCQKEFTEKQALEYLRKLGYTSTLPKWLPKKPLIFQVIESMEQKDAKEILSSTNGQVGFWGQFIDAVCHREVKIHNNAIDVQTVRGVLNYLAKTVRKNNDEKGRLTPKDFDNAYKDLTGIEPDEAGRLMLSRLCTLGRIEPETPDRCFVDDYIFQALASDCLFESVIEKDYEELKKGYIRPLSIDGINLLSQKIDSYGSTNEVISFMMRDEYGCSQLTADLLSAITLIPGDDIDFSLLKVSASSLPILSFQNRIIKNIKIESCIIDAIYLSNCKCKDDHDFIIDDSEISRIYGLASKEAKPQWIKDSCKIFSVENLSSSARIKEADLKPAQKLFLSVIHKIFFQIGGGRKENSLYKGGFGQAYDREIIDKILAKLVKEGYVRKSKDGSTFIYNPNREYTSKMKKIKDQLTLCKDELWLEIEKIN